MATCERRLARSAPMSKNEKQDEAAASKFGKDRILADLFRKEAGRIARYIRGRIGRTDDVQDLVQEAFARLATAGPAILSDRPEAYLQRIARNLVVDLFRSGEGRRAQLQVPVEEALFVSTAPEQEWAIEADDVRRRFVAALDGLAPRTREIFLMHRTDGLTYEEIGRQLELTTKGVEYHMAKALSHLHQEFYSE